jgi:Tfp pilus tip-associated adhesin PilY1
MMKFFQIFKKIKFQILVPVMMICMASGIPQSYADFDPVNDDTDIFLANPNVVSQRPNVLLYIDNTANWNTAFANEKSALVSVVNNLSDQFNLGMMLYPETGGGNDNIDGAYLRYAVRQMTPANKAVLSGLVNAFNVNTDKGNNATLSEGMVDLYRYFNGGVSYSSFGKEKTDFANNTIGDGESFDHEASVAGIGDHALPASPTSSSTFTSPIAAACQKNFVIYLSNGPANENASSLSNAETELAALGYDTSSTISISPDGQEGSWADEWAQYMANADLSATGGTQNATFYTVEVDPGGQNSDLAMTALMKSVALHGNGEYFDVSSANGGQAIVNALNTIFTEIQAVNSVFASTTLPVSVNVRGTNLNQVYIGVFRPDETKNPRWFGNLKMYKLGFDDSTSTLFLADAAGTPAENPATGFINASSASFWTESSTFWDYRTTEENGTGGASDGPDGDLVEKGGAAQQLREAFSASQATRNLYTCNGACADGDSLSATPFTTSNSDITNANLGLGTVAISTLTGFETKNVTAITDIKSVTAATTAAGGTAVSSINSAAVGQGVTNLTSISINAITALDNGAVVKSFNYLNRKSGNPKIPVEATITGHGYTNGQVVHIAGVGASEYNGSKVITVTNTNEFTYDPGTSNPVNNPNFASATVTTTTAIVTATVANHGLTSGNSVTVAGVVPTTFNDFYPSVNVIDANTISFTTAAALAPITSIASATISAASTAATATVSGHGFSAGDSVLITGAGVSAYDGSYTITRAAANDFSFTIPVSLADDNSGSALVYAGTATATATTIAAHGFVNGAVVSITGANPSTLNGSYVIFNAAANTFDYTTTSSADDTDGGITVSAGTSNVAIVTIPDHKLSVGDFITVTGFTDQIDYNVSNEMVDAVVDFNTIQYTVVNTPGPATDFSATMAKLSSPTAFVSLTAHGYANGNTITIEGASPTEYNKTDVSITVIDTDTFKYAISSAQNSAASGTITAKKKTTNALVRAANHGFSGGDNVAIAGATPTAFNGTFTITLNPSDTTNEFSYTLPSAQGDASGTLTASSGSGSSGARDQIINWVRGEDNSEDEDGDGNTTEVRASIHSDVLHSRPAVVNYNRHGNDDDVFVYYGGNDGVFRAVKGGFDQSDAATTALEPFPGQEAWGFIPEEFFPQLERLRNNEPTITSSNKKPYFADGTIGTLAEDNSGPGGEVVPVPDGKIDVDNDNDSFPDKVNLFISMRRGGRFIYALDVSDPFDPKLLWRKSNNDTGFGELGYTWSAPNVITTAAISGEPIILMGAGYDPEVEDIDPSTITAITSTTVTANAGVFTRTMGRGIFALNAEDGDIIWQAGPGPDPGTHPYVVVDGMDYAIPSDVVAITDRDGSVDNRAYVGDTGGNMWRVDMDNTDPEEWKVTKLASIADPSGLAEATPDPSGLRKFLFPPDVVYSTNGYDAVLIGSGDREHPFDITVINRFYMFKDTGVDPDTPLIDTTINKGSLGATPLTVVTNDTTLTESDLFDATSNCIQASAGCSESGDEINSSTAATALDSANGWYITLLDGEKVVGNSVTLNNITFFNTNQPATAISVDPTDCASNLGVARQYKVGFDDATAYQDQNIDGTTDASDRFTTHVGGGYLPSPVPVVVEIDGEIHEGVISGVAVDEPPGSSLNSRLRKFWYKEFE